MSQHHHSRAQHLVQPADDPLPQAAAPQEPDPQSHRHHEPQVTHTDSAGALLQRARRCQSGDRAGSAEEAVRQARGLEASRCRTRDGARGAEAVVILLAALLLAIPPLQTVIIATPRGVTSIPLTAERGGPAVAASRLAVPLGLTAEVSGA